MSHYVEKWGVGREGWNRLNVQVPYAGHGDDFTGVYMCEIYHLFKIWASCISPT